LYTPLLSPDSLLALPISFFSFLSILLGEEYRYLSSSLCSFLHSPATLSLLGPNFLKTPSVLACYNDWCEGALDLHKILLQILQDGSWNTQNA
jgi:hypothetical protein